MTTTTQWRQRGLSMIGFLFVATVVLVVALLAFRMIPAYIEYYTIQKALEAALADSSDLSTTTIRRAMDRKLSADYADAITPRDVAVTKQGNVVTASASWQKILPLVSNVSLLLEFDASASR
jgi:Tfp pilus assembly major pilin PilA